MKCPNCPDATLTMAERAGVEIDYCPTCRGVWLDRGELDKILERAAAQERGGSTPPPQQAVQQQMQPQQMPYHGKPDDSHYGYPSPYGKRRKTWLSELFD